MKDLIKIIKANPGCWAEIDNDCWSLFKEMPDFSKLSDDEITLWWETARLASSNDELEELPGAIYQADNCYGGSLLKALAAIQGVGLESA